MSKVKKIKNGVIIECDCGCVHTVKADTETGNITLSTDTENFKKFAERLEKKDEPKEKEKNNDNFSIFD